MSSPKSIVKWTVPAMRPRTVRSGLVTGTLVILAAVGYIYLAPAQIGGSTRYVVTSGVSMEPHFHTGDLALVRPAARYRVGEIVAYHNTLLRTVVLHRIVALHGDRYVFKGDHNNFLDPSQPTRAQLIGALWLRIPHGGRVLKWLHTPLTAAAVTGVAALLLLVGVKEKRRRRKHHRNGANRSGGPRLQLMNPRHHGTLPPTVQAMLLAAAVAVVLFTAAGVVAFTRSPERSTTERIPYAQQVAFGYHASVGAGPVYPTGMVRTGDPIFLSLVHRLGVQIAYRFSGGTSHRVTGTEQVFVQLAGPAGWSRSFPISPVRRFTGDHFQAAVTLNLPSILSLLARIQALTGIPVGTASMSVTPEVTVDGRLDGRPIKSAFSHGLNFTLQPQQLQLGAPGSSGSSNPAAALSASQPGSVAVVGVTALNRMGVGSFAVTVGTARWAAVVGLVLALAAIATLFVILQSAPPFQESQRIQSKYGHLIVPIVATAEALSWAPYEVPDIKALARLAESGDRLILHHRDEEGDTYLVNDESTVYRYRIRDNRVRWEEWSEPRASLGLRPASAAGDHPPPGHTLPHPDRGEQAEPGGQAHGVGDPGQVGTA